jgi:SHS2 domain-containing protein
MVARGFEEVEHTADVAIRVMGRDMVELFANAASGLAYQLADVASVRPVQTEALDLQANDSETLLVTWLGELLYLAERDGYVYTGFDIRELTPTRLRAVVRGGPASERRRYIKAVTFSNLQIVRTEAGYEATVVFDV